MEIDRKTRLSSPQLFLKVPNFSEKINIHLNVNHSEEVLLKKITDSTTGVKNFRNSKIEGRSCYTTSCARNWREFCGILVAVVC